MLFGRCFEKALAAYFRREDSAAVLFKEWATYRDTALDYSNGDTWDRLLHQGVQLLEQFARDDRVRIRQPLRNLQVKRVKALPNGSQFVSYIDAIGLLDGTRCLLEWKTTSCRYPEEPKGLLALDPQLTCYSWVTGLEEAAVVAYVRKRTPEIQYLRTAISEEQRCDYAQLVEESIARIDAGQFLAHSGIRFPQNGCVRCPFLGLCLNQSELVDSKLVRVPGASDLDWLDELEV